MNKRQLAATIWKSANEMRSKIEANEYKDYILGFIFYRYLSEKELRFFKEQGMSDEDIKEMNESDKDFVDFTKESIGYFIAYENLFSTWLEKGSDFDVSDVRRALTAFDRLISPSHKKVFEKIFNTLQTGLSKLGETATTQTKSINALIKLIRRIPMDGRQDYDVLGFIYEYLIGQFAANAGKKAGEFYTPHEVSMLMSEIVANHLKDRTEIRIYDPTSGSGSLLINMGAAASKYISGGKRISYYAQELKENTYNLTRMNLVMRDIDPANIYVRNGDTLEEDWPFFEEGDIEHYQLVRVDAVVSNPPYSQKWDSKNKEHDARFSDYGIAPRGKADYAFLLHDLYHLEKDGIMAIVLPHGVLFRRNEEYTIRKNLIEKNNIDAIIGLPGNIFFGTSIQTLIMVLKRERTETDVLIIDASKGFEKAGKSNRLRSSDIKRIVDCIRTRAVIPGFSERVSKERIKENDYNLNIPRYVDSYEKPEPWDLHSIMFGGIPNAELDALDEYWKAFPTLRDYLYKPISERYVQTAFSDIEQAVSNEVSVVTYKDKYAEAFADLRKKLRSALIEQYSTISAQAEEEKFTTDIFRRLETNAVIDKQSFDDYRAFSSASEEIQDTADTNILVGKLKSDDKDDTLIITSIQKLSNVTRDAENIKTSDIDKIVAKRMVIIIDEAHRSTFGEMLTNIKNTFIHAIIFGFTGTPIQDANSKKDNTTTTVFGNELHRYTLGDGIRDKNVLGFDPYMESTFLDIELREKVALMKAKAQSYDEVKGDPKKEKIYHKFTDSTQVKMYGEQRGRKYVKGIEDYIPNSQYEEEKHQKTVVENIVKYWNIFSRGGMFHAIFATSSIPEAVAYYRLFKSEAPHLRITAVFDPNIDNEGGGSLEKEDGIVEILEDYETIFGPSFGLPTYDSFREDVQLRLAHKKPYNRIPVDKQINLLIVVNQMLTGFDSKWINALYLDKVMEYENLIQAFSRTNRLYGDEKPFGIIKYYRRTHTMRRNIEIAVKAYSGDIPTGLFVDKLPGNLNSMNRFFDEIADLFKNAGVENFEKLPEEKSEQRKFAKLFKMFNQRLEAAQIQGFNWSKDTYTVSESDGSESYIVMHFDYNTYLALLQRYKELPSAGGGGAGEEPPFEIDTHITEINTDAIDADYMNSRFDKFFRLLQQGDVDKETLDQVLKDLHKSYSMLPREQQKYANLFISDVQSGEIIIDPTMTFRDYIALYMRRSEDARIARIVRRLGCYENLLRKLLDRKVTETNYKEFGYFDELVASVDKGKAKKFFIVIERDNYKDYRLNMYISAYLKKFVISGGVDPYADIIDSGRKSTKKDVDEYTPTPSGDYVVAVDTTNDDEAVGDVIVRTTVKSQKLNQWYQSSQAVACMMNTGCFAYVENKVCLDEPKYVERQESGKMRLTSYAKEHEEECFLQFKLDADGNLHYVKLPESVADKEFRYSDHISEEILTQYGLVNEIANQMLAAIRDMEFGDALKELMSERICHYSVGLLKSTTGLDNRTISNMREGKNLTDVNVVSACLGIHLPFPVSNNMLELANLIFRMDKGPDKNKTYIQLLTLRWASDYGDIYDDLEEQGLEELIKKPPI